MYIIISEFTITGLNWSKSLFGGNICFQFDYVEEFLFSVSCITIVYVLDKSEHSVFISCWINLALQTRKIYLVNSVIYICIVWLRNASI